MRKMPEQRARKSPETVESDIQQFEGSAGDEKLMKFIAQRVNTSENEGKRCGFRRAKSLARQRSGEKEREQPKGAHMRERSNNFCEPDIENVREINPLVNRFRQQSIRVGA